MRRAAPLGLALLLVSCAGGGSVGAAPTIGAPGATAAASAAPSVALSIMSSTYGAVQIKTDPGASCTLAITVDHGQFGDGPPSSLSGIADGAGLLGWTYPAPLVPSSRSKHQVQCADTNGTSTVSADFDVRIKTLDARGFTVRTQAVDVTGLTGVQTQLDPSLVPPRNAVLTRINATLASEWKAATRGLGALTLVESSADIVIYVLPGRGTSVHSLASDGTQRVLLYVVDDTGPLSAENAVAVALHELGHIWCCFGPAAGPDGHWLEKLPDPLLQGVDQYGLMTHPVTCLVKPGIESCPNRFSDRELRMMGFTDIPAPPPDPCVTQATGLEAQFATINARLAATKKKIDAIAAQYPSLVLPPDVYATYNALVAQYNSDVDAANAIVKQRNALPC